RYFGFPPLVIEPGIRTGMPILYDNPKEVGADRIANAVGAFDLYGGPSIVVDFGTATTIEAVSANGEYLGGAIFPGIEISLDPLRAARIHPYPVRFDRSTTAGELHELYDTLADGEETEAVARIAGRVLLRRQMGKLVFLTLRDASGSVQLFVSRAVVGDAAF